MTPGSPGNFVAPALLSDGTHGVLKVGAHGHEARGEIAALRVWNGRGAVRLFASDLEMGDLLMERAEPGTMLAEIAASDDDAATRIAAGLLRDLWLPATSAAADLTPLEVWCGAFDRTREALLGGVPDFPRALFEHAHALCADLLASTRAPVVLHGDLHHFNVLRSSRAGWLAIDPKGLVGDRCFDICQFLLNPHAVPASVNRRRIDIFCAELGLDPQRARAWCTVHAVLNACWAFENGDPPGPRVAYAEQTLSF